jgi:hypothetical protein
MAKEDSQRSPYSPISSNDERRSHKIWGIISKKKVVKKIANDLIVPVLCSR